MALSLRKSLQEIFVFTNGYSVTRAIDCDTKSGSKWSLDIIRSLKQEQFIELCAGYFEEKGYRTTINTQHDKNFISIWLFKGSYSAIKPFGVVKCWETKAIKVDSEEVNQFAKIVIKNQIPLGVFVTAGEFAENVTVRVEKRVKMIHGKDLLELIQSLSDIRNQRLSDKFFSQT